MNFALTQLIPTNNFQKMYASPLLSLSRIIIAFLIPLALICPLEYTFAGEAGDTPVDEKKPPGSEEPTPEDSDKTPNNDPTSLTGDDIHSGAKEGKKKDNTGMIVNFAVGGVFTGICTIGCPTTSALCFACPMAVMSLAQGAVDAAAKSDSGKVADITLNTPVPDPPPPGGGGKEDPPDPENPPPNEEPDPRDVIAGKLETLKKMGYYMSDDNTNVVTPDGEIPVGLFSNPDSLSKVGYTPQQIASTKGFIKQGEDAALKALGEKDKEDGKNSSSTPDYMTGGPIKGGGKDGSADEESSSHNSLFAGLTSKRKPASSKGLVRRLQNGEYVGVQGDDIFEMVRRRYESKKKEDIFIEW